MDVYTRACSWISFFYWLHSFFGWLFFRDFAFLLWNFFGFSGIFYFFCWFDVFGVSGFFDFLMFFDVFLDFSMIFFLEFLTGFTHQKGYILLQFSCNLFFFVYTGWRRWGDPVKVTAWGLRLQVWYLTGYAKV